MRTVKEANLMDENADLKAELENYKVAMSDMKGHKERLEKVEAELTEQSRERGRQNRILTELLDRERDKIAWYEKKLKEIAKAPDEWTAYAFKSYAEAALKGEGE